MRSRGILYNGTTGKIKYLVNTSGPYYDQPIEEAGDVSLDISHITRSLSVNKIYYDVVNSEVIDRPTMSLTLSGLTITGVPLGASVTVTDSDGNYNKYQIDDGKVDMTGSSPGTYRFRFENFPYMEERLEVTVE